MDGPVGDSPWSAGGGGGGEGGTRGLSPHAYVVTNVDLLLVCVSLLYLKGYHESIMSSVTQIREFGSIVSRLKIGTLAFLDLDAHKRYAPCFVQTVMLPVS